MNENPNTAPNHYLDLDDESLLAQCDVDCYRASGPGGQKRNKTSSAVRLRHRPTGLAAIATEDRSQHVNKARAIRRLRMTIATSIRNPVETTNYVMGNVLTSCVSAAATLSVGRRDQRYPQALCELLDLLEASDASVRDCADLVGVSTANLVKFFRNDPNAWKCANQIRARKKRKPLR